MLASVIHLHRVHKNFLEHLHGMEQIDTSQVVELYVAPFFREDQIVRAMELVQLRFPQLKTVNLTHLRFRFDILISVSTDQPHVWL